MSGSLAKARLLISLGALSAALCACGGGGGGSSSPGSASANAPSTAAPATGASDANVASALNGSLAAPSFTGGFSFVPAPGASAAQTALTGDTAADSLIQLNNYRAKIGLPALVANSGVAQAASNHAKYNHLNNAFLHDETLGKPGFTAANFFDRISQYIVANWGGEVAVTFSSGFASSTQPTDILFAAPFHRAVMLDDFEVAGVGYAAPDSTSAAGNMVMDLANEKAFVSPTQLVAYPYSGQTDAQTSWFSEETPNPFAKSPQYANQTVGYPVSLSAAEGSAFSNIAFTLTDPSGASVPCEESDDSNNEEASHFALCVPYKPFSPNTVYTAKVSGTITRQGAATPFSATWTFATTPTVSAVARKAVSGQAAATPSLAASPAVIKKAAN